jgi:triosephosphate isomerase
MRRKLVVGNWKMHGTKNSVADLLSGLKSGFCGGECLAEIVLCSPYVFFPQIEKTLAGTKIQWGSQDLSDKASGAYTGEVSAQMIVESGCRFAIVGHSERRALFGETEPLVIAKFVAAQAAGLRPIFCMGETAEQREAGEALSLIEGQIQALIDTVGIAVLSEAVIAYEPVWAIGTGKTATPEQAQDMHRHIRHVVAKSDVAIAENLQILYGGSVNAANAADLFAMEDIDGALVGGASLSATDFAVICEAASVGMN